MSQGPEAGVTKNGVLSSQGCDISKRNGLDSTPFLIAYTDYVTISHEDAPTGIADTCPLVHNKISHGGVPKQCEQTVLVGWDLGGLTLPCQRAVVAIKTDRAHALVAARVHPRLARAPVHTWIWDAEFGNFTEGVKSMCYLYSATGAHVNYDW